MGAAKRLLEGGCEVVLIEAGRRIGGNCFGVDVQGKDGRAWRVDAGVSDFNLATFTEVKALIDELGFEVRPIRQDASFATTSGEVILSVKDGKLAASRKFVADGETLFAEMQRMKQALARLARDESPRSHSAREFFAASEFSSQLVDYVFSPRASGCFAMPDAPPLDYPIASLARFWLIHGIVGDTVAERVCIPGGMHQYPDRFAQRFKQSGGQILLDTRVVGVRRRNGKVLVRAVTGADEHLQLPADQVVFATNSVDVVPLLEDATPRERDLFLAFPYQRAELVVHRDPALMPADRAAWGSFNYVVAGPNEELVRPTITFYPKHMQHMPESAPDVFVTMNPHRPIADDKLILRRFFVHPVARPETLALAADIEALQGEKGAWFCGAYLLEPWVHEPALVSGLRVAEKLLARMRETGAAPPRIEPQAPPIAVGNAMFVLRTARTLDLSRICHVKAVREREIVVARARTDLAPAGTMLLACSADDASGYVVYEAPVVSVDGIDVTLGFPVRVGFLPRRRAERAKVKLDLSIVEPESGARIEAFTLDVSPIGALCEVVSGARVFEDDSWMERVVDVTMRLPDRASPIAARARIIRVASKSDGPVKLALALFDLATLDRLELEVTALRATSRRHVRAVVAIPARVVRNGADLSVGIVDLSGGGCLVSHDGALASLPIGGEVELAFVLPVNHVIRATAKVVRHPRAHQMALSFEGLDEASTYRVGAYVLHVFRELSAAGAR